MGRLEQDTTLVKSPTVEGVGLGRTDSSGERWTDSFNRMCLHHVWPSQQGFCAWPSQQDFCAWPSRRLALDRSLGYLAVAVHISLSRYPVKLTWLVLQSIRFNHGPTNLLC